MWVTVRVGCPVLGNRFAREVRTEVLGGEPASGEEPAELGETRTRGVETHLVEQFLDVGRIVAEQRYAPLEVVEADAPGDDLGDSSGVLFADLAVIREELGTLVEREFVPVVIRPRRLSIG